MCLFGSCRPERTGNKGQTRTQSKRRTHNRDTWKGEQVGGVKGRDSGSRNIPTVEPGLHQGKCRSEDLNGYSVEVKVFPL